MPSFERALIPSIIAPTAIIKLFFYILIPSTLFAIISIRIGTAFLPTLIIALDGKVIVMLIIPFVAVTLYLEQIRSDI